MDRSGSRPCQPERRQASLSLPGVHPLLLHAEHVRLRRQLLDDGRRAGRIRGAQPLPYGEKSAKEVGFDAAKDRLDLAQIADKNTPVIFACNGAECWKSYKACVTAAKAGFTQVYWFRGGYPEWLARGLPVD